MFHQQIAREDLLHVFEMYPEFVDSFNSNLKITFNLRDETQKGVTVTRYIRNRAAAHSRTDRSAARRLSVVSPLTDDEEGQYFVSFCSFSFA